MGKKIIGIFLVGLGGFFQLFVTLVYRFPLHGVHDLFPSSRGGGRGGGGDNTALIILIIIIVIGLFRAIYSVYCLVNWLTETMLARAGTIVLDVPTDLNQTKTN